jgi:predicted metal-dependent peptidase
MISQTETDFNLDRHLISFLQDDPFFAEFSRHVRKVPSTDLPTAAIAYDKRYDELTLFWNPKFFSSLSAREVRGVLRHEYYHPILGHLTGRHVKDTAWNVATDLAINSIVVQNCKNTHLDGDRDLPESCLIPGVFPKNPAGRDFTPEEKSGMKLASLIEKLPPMKSSEWYLEKLKQELDPEDMGGGSGGSFDDHSMWDDVPDEMKEYVKDKVKNLVEKAVKYADSRPGGWGSVPTELAEAIRKSVSNAIDWKLVLRQFVGSLVRGERSSSIKRINKRYPYIHPGVKKGHVARLLVAIDMSGSVSNEMLTEFFGVLGSLTKKVTIDVIPFDCDLVEKDLFTWQKGSTVAAKRVRGGGTDFNAPTDFANDKKNRGRWDGMLVLTDGEAPAPGPSRIKRGWVLARGCKLAFSTNETKFAMDAEKKNSAW